MTTRHIACILLTVAGSLAAAEPSPEEAYMVGLTVGKMGAAATACELLREVLPHIDAAEKQALLRRQLAHQIYRGLQAYDRAAEANKTYPYVDPIVVGESWGRAARKLETAIAEVDLTAIENPEIRTFLEQRAD